MYNEKEYDKNYYQKNKEKIKQRSAINCGGVKVQYARRLAKEECRKKANYICQVCGKEGIDAHHLIPVEQGGTDEQSNLICLCRSCHQKIHKGSLVINSNGEILEEKKPKSWYQAKEFYHERAELKRQILSLAEEFHNMGFNAIWHSLIKLKKDIQKLSLEEVENYLKDYRKFLKIEKDKVELKEKIKFYEGE